VALYDFVCADCGHSFEVFSIGFIKTEQQQCPQCGSRNVQQKFSSFLSGGSRSSSSPSSGCAAPTGSPFG
jgi:putative FmdB family regulatory protein